MDQNTPPVAVEVTTAKITPHGHDDDAKPAAGDDRFYSVTTLIGALDKPAIVYWAAEQTAISACQIAGSLPARIAEDGEEAVVKWLRDARFRPPKGIRSSAELGSAVHDAVETYALTGTRPEVDEEVLPFLDQFDAWAQQFSPVYEAAEAAVYNRTFGYAGTLDAICVIDGQRVLVDYKTTRKDVDGRGKPTGPYPEVALQLAAYRHAELLATFTARRFEQFRRRYYLLSEVEAAECEPMPKVDGAVVIHMTPNRCTAHPVRVDQSVFDAFLYAVECFRWQQDLSKRVIGAPLELGVAA